MTWIVPFGRVSSAEKRAISAMALSMFGTRLAIERSASISYARTFESSDDAITKNLYTARGFFTNPFDLNTRAG
jgi:hypothetical protein